MIIRILLIMKMKTTTNNNNNNNNRNIIIIIIIISMSAVFVPSSSRGPLQIYAQAFAHYTASQSRNNWAPADRVLLS